MMALTAKQQRLLEFIQDFMARNHYPPTYEEMRVGLDWSTKSLVDYHLSKLEAAGRIKREYALPRTIRLV